jgi:hypothetical protein
VLDGRLNDTSWQQAARVPPGPQDQPVQPALMLGCDPSHLYFAASFPTAAENCFQPSSTASDAAGAVDGVKNGRYGFHTNYEPNPWWQVDLGSSQPIGKVVVYNRLDYAPGFHNADPLLILASDDGKSWLPRYENQGRSFGGIAQGKPLVVDFGADRTSGGHGPLKARFVRIQIPSAAPIFLHFDEVEIYAPGDPAMQKNLALGRPADQSSRSPWSRGGELAALGRAKIGLAGTGPSACVTLNGKPLAADRARLSRDRGTTTLEAALKLDGDLAGFPGQITPFHSQPIPLFASQAWQLIWPEPLKLGFGKNRLALAVRAEKPLSGPLELSAETVVFTPQRAERQVVFRKVLERAGPAPIEFQVAHEGAAALVITLRQGESQASEAREFFVAPVGEALARAGKLAAGFSIPLPEPGQTLQTRMAALNARETAEGCDLDARRALYREARWLARRVAFADPRLAFDKLLFMKRFTQQAYPDVCLNHMPWVSRPGGDICILSMAGPEAEGQVKNLIDRRLGPGHVHGIDLRWDAKRIVFGYAKAKSHEPPAGWLDRRTSFDLRRSEEPTHIFEIGADGSGLRQLTRGEWSDLDPTYAPSGDIVFISERCGYSLQCNEYDKDETSTNLYVMRPDGSNIRRMSVTKDGD